MIIPAHIRAAAIDETWRRGDLSYLFHAGQRVLDKHYRDCSPRGKLIVANISRQFGKTAYGVKKSIETALRIPMAQIRVGTAFLSDLVKFIEPAFEKFLHDCPEDLKPEYNRSQHAYRFPNGSVIYLVGIDKNPNGLRGATLDFAFLDECGFIDSLALKTIYISVLLPATLHRPNAKILMASTPPDEPGHQFLEYMRQATAAGTYIEMDVYKNPMLSPAQIATMCSEVGGKDSAAWRREFLCEPVIDLERLIIPEWKTEYCQEVEPNAPYHHLWHRYVALDIGMVDWTALLFGYYDFKKAQLIIEDEFQIKGKDLTSLVLADAVKAKEKDLWGNAECGNGKVFRRIADNNNLILLNDMSSAHNVHFAPTTKDDLHAMVGEVREFVAAGRLLVHPRCRRLLACLQYGLWDSKRKGFGRQNEEVGHNDALAALVYMIRNLARNSNPIPPGFGFTPDKAWMGHVDTDSHNAKAIKKLFARR